MDPSAVERSDDIFARIREAPRKKRTPVQRPSTTDVGDSTSLVQPSSTRQRTTYTQEVSHGDQPPQTQGATPPAEGPSTRRQVGFVRLWPGTHRIGEGTLQPRGETPPPMPPQTEVPPVKHKR